MDLAAENLRLREQLDVVLKENAALQTRVEAAEEVESALRTRVAAAEEIETALRARAEAAEAAATRLQHELAMLKRQLTGPSSERIVVDPAQLALPIEPAEPEDAQAEADEVIEPKQVPRKKRRRGGRRKIEDMHELRTVVHEQRVEDRFCPCGCGATARTIGEDVSWRIERKPAEIYRIKTVQEKVAFPDHQGEGVGTVVTAPPRVAYALPRAMCGNGLLAQIVLDKYLDHLPLHRQEQRFQREGLDLSRQSLCDWVLDLADLLVPIVGRMELEVRADTWLRADATGMPVYAPERVKGRTHLGHLWAWGNYDAVIFTFTWDKRGETVAQIFEGFAGTVLIDGASDFNLLEKSDGVTRAGCWAHARRKLYEALSYDSELALRGLAAIRMLFLAERVVMAAPLEERLARRRELCQPVVDGIRQWVEEELPRQIVGSPAYKALKYLDNQWSRLVVFLETAEIACHNNDTERDLRRPVKGKANFHYARSERGAKAMTVYYTLLGTCLLQGINPRAYLKEILGRLDEPPAALTPQAIRAKWERLTA